MKRRVLGIFLAMIFVFAYAVPAAATEENTLPTGTDVVAGSSETVSDDALVQDAYDAYINMVDAMGDNEADDMRDSFNKYIEITNKFTGAQHAEWDRVVKNVLVKKLWKMLSRHL